jgi:hypothetical protein
MPPKHKPGLGEGVCISDHRYMYKLDGNKDRNGNRFDFVNCGTVVGYREAGNVVVFFTDAELKHYCIREVKVQHLVPEYEPLLPAEMKGLVFSLEGYECETQSFALGRITEIYNNDTWVWAKQCNSCREWNVKLQRDVVVVY